MTPSRKPLRLLTLEEVEEKLAEAKTHVLGCDCDIDLLETARAALKVVEAAKTIEAVLSNTDMQYTKVYESYGSIQMTDLQEALAPFRD